MSKSKRTMMAVLALGIVLAGIAMAGPEAGPRPAVPSPTPPAPLIRDPVFDGAADPSLVWNDTERSWWALYTNRRANAPDAQDGVRWCHGTDIGIASSPDGRTWTYRGTAQGLEFEPGRNTFWAPCLVVHGGAYHMFAAYVSGVPADWSGDRHIVHYTSRDLVHWKFEAIVPLSSERVIDAFIYGKPAGGWRMWYKDEANGSHIYAADSEDLFRWSVKGPVVTGTAQEGPAVFFWRGAYWMLVDRWQGMGVLRSDDLERWTEQPGTILGVPGTRPDDGDIGRHGEVVVQGPEAYLFYFTHPFGPKDHVQPGKHRSSLQVARLEFAGGRIACDRDKPFDLDLAPPSGFRPAMKVESPLALRTSDAKLAAAFAWAKGQALDYAFPAAVHGDPVGDWYEAALPGRFAFCMRDVSHQATGAHVLGLAGFNLNMLRKFAAGMSPARQYASYWEIDKWDRPAPVDYKNDLDFWYNLPANFDVMDACWRQFLWTGNRAYLDDPAFLDFYRLSATAYVNAWDNDGDGVPDHRPVDGNRGLGSYDEGELSDLTMVGADLVACQTRAFLSYAKVLRLKGDPAAAAVFEGRAAGLRAAFRDKWWDPKLGRFAGLMLQGGRLTDYGSFWQGLFSLYAGLIEPGPARERTMARLLERKAGNIEMESYLPEVFYRYGRAEAAYAEVLKLSDPGKKRREYPEVPFALVGAIAAGTMGIEPEAGARVLATRSRLTAATDWAELAGVPVSGNVIDVRHDGRARSALTNRSGPALAWRAVFDGKWKELAVDGRPTMAFQGTDEAGQDVSWVTAEVPPGGTVTVTAGETGAPKASALSPRWDESRARAWAGARPWTLGCNYIPRTALNTLEMWQAATFDPATIDQELGWAESLGFNAVRVFLHYALWEQDQSGFLGRLEDYLKVADRHHIGTIFVLFDDCWNDEWKLGPQPAPRPGVHNSGWVRCPGTKMLAAPSRWGVLESYTRGVVKAFRGDRRVLAWDLYNEPGGPKTLPLLKKIFEWARSVASSQPLTAGVWDESKELEELNRFQVENSDIISFHAYFDEAGTRKRLAWLKTFGRPTICTEYMARGAGSRFETILPLFKAEDTGAMNWGLVSGKTQTIFPWGSKEGSPEPALWHHDIFRPDGTPFAAAELKVIRETAGIDRPIPGTRTSGTCPLPSTGPSGTAGAFAAPHQAWAATPPMGWNSWDSFGQAVTEAEVKANADFMAARLARFGWRYVVVDIQWYEPQMMGPDYPLESRAEVDEFGRFRPAENKFPSAAGGKGLKPLAEYVHGKGLRFGLHVVRGIPRQAVERNTPIQGTAYRAADIALKTDYCPWNMDQWGVDTAKPGAQEWYDSLFRLLAAWGVDLVKVDDISQPYRTREVEILRAAIDSSGRPIVLSLSPGPTPLDRGGHVAANANMWRLLGDLWDYWDQVLPAFRKLHDWTPFAGPGRWPDPDMLPLGHLRYLPPGWSRNVTTSREYFAMTAHGGQEGVPNFLTADEQRTVMTLWTIARCPLMFGGHLPASDEWTMSLITNEEVLAVNQRSRGNRQLCNANGLVAWVAEDEAGGAKYLAVFNTADRADRDPAEGLGVPVRLADLGLKGECSVRDLWAKKDLGPAGGEFAPVVPWHGAGLYRLTQKGGR
jgi:alpha-galactosidase